MRSSLLPAGLVLLASAAGVRAVEPHELYGLWSTPGGNLVHIDEDHHRALFGRLTSVNEASAADGFAPGQHVLTDFRLSTGGVSFQVDLRPTDAERPEAEAERVEFRGSLSADGKKLEGRLLAGEGALTMGTREVEGGETPAVYERVSLAPVQGELGPLHRFERVSAASVTFRASSEEPMGAGLPQLSVRLALANGEPFELSEIAWEAVRQDGPALRATYYTVTDSSGVAPLKFVLLPDGDFAPANQVHERPELKLPPGTYRVRARSLGVPGLEPVEFTAVLDAWPQVQFLDPETREVISSLVLPELRNEVSFRLRVIHKGRIGRPRERDPLRLTLTSFRLSYRRGSPEPDRSRHDGTPVDLPWQAAGVYGGDLVLTARIGAGRTTGMTVSDRVVFLPLAEPTSNDPTRAAELDAYVPEHTLRMPLRVYSDSWTQLEDSMRQGLHEADNTIEALVQSVRQVPAEHRPYLDAKRRLIGRALAVLDDEFDPSLDRDSRIPGPFQFHIAREYATLIAKNCFRFDPAAPVQDGLESHNQGWVPDPDCYRPVPEGRTHDVRFNETGTQDWKRALPYGYREERDALERSSRVILRWRDNVRDRYDPPAFYARLLQGATAQAKVALPYMLAYPIFAAYTLVTGESMEGERLTALDRLHVGLDLATLRLNTRHRAAVLRQARDNAHLTDMVRRNNPGLSAGAGFQLQVARPRLLNFRERLEAARDAAIDRILALPVSDELKRRQLEVVGRVHSYRLTEAIRRRQERWERRLRRAGLTPAEANIPDRFQPMLLGSLEHLVRLYEKLAYWEWQRSLGRAVGSLPVPRGSPNPTRFQRYRQAGGTLEEMFEWSIEVDGRTRRIDHAIVSHAPVELELPDGSKHRFAGTVDITDWTLGLELPDPNLGRLSHSEKTRLYGDIVRSLPEFKGYFVRVKEIDWSLTDGSLIEQHVGTWLSQ